MYWYCTPDGHIVASRTHSTRFVVRAVEPSLAGKVMVNADAVHILLGCGTRSLSVAQSGQLQAGGRADTLRFGDFVDGFAVDVDASSLEAMVVKANDDEGEPWELTLAGRVDLAGKK